MAKPALSPSNYKTLAKKRQAVPADPFAPMSPGAINQTVGKYTSMYGNPQTDSQIQSGAQASLDPLIAAMTKSINDRAGQASSAITGNANSLAHSLGQIDYTSPYNTAKSEQSAVDEALRASLSGAGSGLSSDLQSRLAALNDPTVSQAGGAVSAYGNGAGNAALANGSANLGSLIAQAAAAKSYGQKMPGIARLAGLQDVAGVNQGAVNDIGTGTTDILKLLPGLVDNARSRNQSLRGDKASTAASLYSTLTGQNITRATASAGLGQDAINNGFRYAQTYGTDPITGQPVKGYHVDAKGNVVKDVAPKAPKPLSRTDRQAMLKQLDTLYYGIPPKQQYDSKNSTWMDVPNTGTPAVDYSTAIQNLVDGFGITVQQATTLANRLYPPGADGRPASKAQKKTKKFVKDYTPGAIPKGLGG